MIPVALPHGIGATQPTERPAAIDAAQETLAPIEGEYVEYEAPCDICGVVGPWFSSGYEHRSKANGTTKVTRATCLCACVEVAAAA
jgi:hypothetical protein